MKVLILANNDVGLYNFRKELINELLIPGSFIKGRVAKPCKVYISLPNGDLVSELVGMGCKFINTPLERHGINPLHELKLLSLYKRIIQSVKPDIVFSYTIKPNIYGAMVAKQHGIPFVANITGLGTAVENGGWKQRVFLALYRCTFSDIQCVFFQNTENRQLFIDNKIAIGKHKMLPGSGVNLDRFSVREYPSDENGVVRFAFISRIMKEKGVDYYLAAAKAIRKKYPNSEFHVCGFCEVEYEGKLSEYNDNGTVIYHGMIHDVSGFLKDIHCVVHPTYYPEGLSNVLLEASASGRPIITTDRAGCREVIDDGINGYMIPCQNGKKLIEAVDKFMKISNDERKKMGLAGRRKVEREFDRRIVVKKYIREIKDSFYERKRHF